MGRLLRHHPRPTVDFVPLGHGSTLGPGIRGSLLRPGWKTEPHPTALPHVEVPPKAPRSPKSLTRSDSPQGHFIAAGSGDRGQTRGWGTGSCWSLAAPAGPWGSGGPPQPPQYWLRRR